MRRAGLPIALLLVGLLAACTGQDGPAPSASPSTTVPVDPVETATETATPETTTPDETIEPIERDLPEKPARPDVMDQEGPVGAEAAAGYFLDLYGYAIQTGDLEDFEEMSAEECEFCRSVIDSTRELYERGGWITGGEIAYGDGYVPNEIPDLTEIDVVFDIDVSAESEFDRTGDPVNLSPEDSGRLRVELQFIPGRWLVHQVYGDFS